MKKRKTTKRKSKTSAIPIHTHGVTLARNEFNKALVQEHVMAVQEHDHRKAHLISKFIVELGSLYKTTPEDKRRNLYLKEALVEVCDLREKISPSAGYVVSRLSRIGELVNCAINCNEKSK